MEKEEFDFGPLVEKFKEPRARNKPMPYVLFGKNGFVLSKTSDESVQWDVKPSLFMLPCDGSHAHKEKIDYYLSKGWKLLKWYLPIGEKADAFEEGGTTNFGDDKDHFLELENHIRAKMGERALIDKENRALRAEKIKTEQEVEKLKKERDALLEESRRNRK